MINTRPYIFWDTETGSLNPKTTQVLEIAAVAICPRKLEIIPNSLFHSRIKPLSDELAIKIGLDPVQKSALDINKIDLEELNNWPNEKTVINNFREYVYQWNPKRDSWNAPIAAHFNGRRFDMVILDRLAQSHGFWDDKKFQQKLFNPIQDVDLKDMMWMINENNPAIEYNNMNAIRDWLQMSKEHSHEATQDVLDGAEILCKCMRWLRFWSAKTKFS